MFVYQSILALLIVTAQCYGQKSYDGWSLIKAHPHDDAQVQYLKSLRENEAGFEFQVWQQGTLERPFDIFLSPEAKEPVLAKLKELNIEYATQSENIQRVLDREQRPLVSHRRGLNNDRSVTWFSKFLKLDEILANIQTLASENPNLVKLSSIGTTHEGKNITLVTISSNGGAPNKPAIWLDGGIHAREWASPATVFYILYQLITRYNTDSNIKSLVDGANWYVVPVLNPDGYDHTHKKDRMWRKNRRPHSRRGCEGVDLNRNFGWGFGGAGTSPDPCDETFRGSYAFSEPEAKAVQNFVLNHKDIKAFLTIHAYSQMWFYPFGDKYNSYPADKKELVAVAQRGARALEAVHGTKYDVGTAADLLYEAAGGSDDWAKGVAGIKYVYCLELRPGGDTFTNGFLLPPDQIKDTAEETWAGLSEVAKAVLGK